MKINKFNITQIIVLFLCCFKLTNNFKISLLGHNSYDNNRSKESESNYYRENSTNNINYDDIPNRGRQRDRHNYQENLGSNNSNEIDNLEIRNQIYNHNIEPISRIKENNENNSSSSGSNINPNSNTNSDTNSDSHNSHGFSSNDNSHGFNSNDNSPKFISRMISSTPQPHHSIISDFSIASCPCANFIKCQPCGLIPDLDFFHKNTIECPCAPKLNCPICPPLSLIHEIAAKKVIYFFN
jgi:hypothetical protein